MSEATEKPFLDEQIDREWFRLAMTHARDNMPDDHYWGILETGVNALIEKIAGQPVNWMAFTERPKKLAQAPPKVKRKPYDPTESSRY
jgi:hypothetical protein